MPGLTRFQGCKWFLRISVIVTFCFVVLISGCRISEPKEVNSGLKVSIQMEGVSSTEAWLRIKAEGQNPLDWIILQRNDSTVLYLNLHGKDTLVCEDSLTPGISYIYKAYLSTGKEVSSSEAINLTTMDTTSHDFHFRSFVVCNRSSDLWDVAIINENDIWAVGRMQVNLPEGKDDPQPVGAVHWDGKEWKQVKVPYKDTWTSPDYPGPLTSVIAFGPDNVYFSSYGGLIKWDGKKFEQKAQFMQDESFNGSVCDIWGSDEKNIYAVGYKGAIYHYTGDNWHKIESGTDLTIRSVWGSPDPATGEEIILCVASNIFTRDDPKVLQIKNDKVTEITADGLNPSLCSLWFKDMNKVYIAGDGDFLKNLNIGKERWNMFSREITHYWSYAVRGNGLNDIFLAGSFGDVLHFNGGTWKAYLGNGVEYSNGNLYGMDVKGNTICAVGTTGPVAVVVLGQR